MHAQLDYKLMSRADAVAAQYVHDKNSLMMAYLANFEMQCEAEFLAAEVALRKFVVDVELERYAPIIAMAEELRILPPFH